MDEVGIQDPESDESILAQLRALIPEGAHPSTLRKALGAYRELCTHTTVENAVLFAYQQIIIEGLSNVVEVKNANDEIAMQINKVSNGGIVMPHRIKPSRN